MGWDLAPFLNGVTGLPAKSRFSRNWRRCPHLNGRQWPSFAPRKQGVARLVRGHHPSTADLSLVVLTDIIVGPLKKLCVLVQFVLEQRLAKRLLYLLLASMHGLPVIETNHLHDLFDVVHDRLTITRVSPFRASSNSAVSAALPRSMSSSLDVSHSVFTTSFASASSSFKKSIDSSKPC